MLKQKEQILSPPPPPRQYLFTTGAVSLETVAASHLFPGNNFPSIYRHLLFTPTTSSAHIFLTKH